MDYQEIDYLEREVTEHVHAQLGEYSRNHYTIDYEDFTAECIAEFLDEIQCAPLTDPTALKLPEDPIITLFKLKAIDALPPYEELDRTSSGAISILKAVQAQMRRVVPGALKCERVVESMLSNNLIPEPAIPPDFMLTASSRRHHRQIGKGRYKKDLPTGFKGLRPTHIPNEMPKIEDPVEPKLPVDELLKVQWDIKQPALRAALESLVKIHKCAPKLDEVHYFNKFSLESEPEAVDIAETRFTVLFPRGRQPGYRPSDTSKSSLEPQKWEDLQALVPLVEANPAPSSDDLPTQNMRLIDGWQTICSSPPSSPDSPGPTDEDFTDELCFPLTPDTDPPLAEDILRPKLAIPLFPRSRKPGGRSGVKPNILKEQKTLATFLPSMIPSEVQLKSEDSRPTPSSPIPATSVLGQASLVDSGAEPNPDDDLDVELKHICGQDVVDPFAPIMEETVDDKSIPLMEVPNLPEPTNRLPSESSWIAKSFNDLVTPNTVDDSQLARPYIKKASAKQSVTLALSWAAITTDEKLPPLTKILDVESPLDSRDSERHAVMLSDVEEFLNKCSITSNAEEALNGRNPAVDQRLLALVEPPPVPKDPFKQPTLLLSRLERQRLKGKRKADYESEVEVEEDLVTEDGGRQNRTPRRSQGSSSPKRARVQRGDERGVSPLAHDDAPLDQLVPDNGGGLLPQQDHHLQGQDDIGASREAPVSFDLRSFQDLGNIMASAQLEPERFDEDDKENWNPSSGFRSDPLFEDFQNHPFDKGNMLVDDNDSLGQMFNAYGFADDDLGFDSQMQMPLDGLGFKQYAEAAFEPLMVDTHHWDEPLRWKEASSSEEREKSHPPSLVPQRSAVSSDTSAQSRQSQASSTLVSRIDPSLVNGLFSHALGLFEFANLRSVKLSRPPQQDLQEQHVEEHQPHSTPQSVVAVPRAESPNKQTIPVDIIDGNTISIGELDSLASPDSIHRYLASLDILQKRALVKALSSPDCFVDLIERTTLGGAHLILDPFTAVMFIPLLTLGAHCESWIEQLAAQSWKFNWIYVVFEAYPESCAFKSYEKRSELNAYTPPILKAVKKFRRDIGLAEAFNTKSTECRIRFGFADCVNDAARIVRYAGDTAEAGDQTGGEIWGDREWLDEDHEDEQDLASVAGMNHFSSALILSQIDLEDFLKMEPQDRLSQFGGFVGADTITALNNDIAQRYERLSSVGDSDHYLDAVDDIAHHDDTMTAMYY